jgi:hypothetical protein
MKSKVSGLLIFLAFLTFAAESSAFLPGRFRTGHSSWLRKHIDTSEWQQSWSDDIWRIECIAIETENGGIDRLLTSCVAEKDRSGDVWEIWKTNQDGSLVRINVRDDFAFTASSCCFFELDRRTNTCTVVGLGVSAGSIAADRVHLTGEFRDGVFLFEDGAPALKKIIPDIDGLFCDDDLLSIERMYSEWYFGYDFKPPKHHARNPYTTWFGYPCPKGNLRLGGGVACPDDFCLFAERLRRMVAGHAGAARRIRVLSVFLDADNDGDADAYVAFATDRTKGGNFRWTLYLNNEGGYTKAEAPVFPVPERRELCELAPSVVSPTNGFCRVVRFDVEPTFLMLDGKGSPTKVRDAITNVLTHRIEKLPCIEIREE